MKKSNGLSTSQLDEKIERILEIKEMQKQLDTEIKSLQREVESQFSLPNDQKEKLTGINFYVEKAPTDLGRNTYDVNLLRPLLIKVRKASNVISIKKTEVVDTKALDALVKEGILNESDVNACRISKWTFKSLFRRNEANK